MVAARATLRDLLKIPLKPGPVADPALKKTPVLLVAGLSQPARHAVVQACLRARRPVVTSPGEPVAEGAGNGTGTGTGEIVWLDNQDWPSQLEAPGPDYRFVACACCTGSVVFSTYLGRALRSRRVAGLVISLSGRAEPLKLLNWLSQEPWQDLLGPVRLLSVMDERALSLLDQPGHPLHEVVQQQKELSWQVLAPGETLSGDPLTGA